MFRRFHGRHGRERWVEKHIQRGFGPGHHEQADEGEELEGGERDVHFEIHLDPRHHLLHHHGQHRLRQELRKFWFGPGWGGGRGGPFHPGRGGPGGPGGGWPHDDDPGGRRRQRRGDIKYALLELLAEQPRHGYELIKELENRYGGFYRPSPGTVYPTLQLLEDEGHLGSETVEGKRTYTITDSGRQLLAERPQREEGHRRHGGREPLPELIALRQSAESLMASVTQLAQHGTAQQSQEAAALLDSTRRALYAILAREDEKML